MFPAIVKPREICYLFNVTARFLLAASRYTSCEVEYVRKSANVTKCTMNKSTVHYFAHNVISA